MGEGVLEAKYVTRRFARGFMASLTSLESLGISLLN